MQKEKYWLWLQYGLGYAGKTKAVIDYFGSAEDFYNAWDSQWIQSGLISEASKAYKRLCEKNPEDFSDVFDFCLKHKIHIVTPDSEYYPPKLLDIDDYPAVLYVRGDVRCLRDSLPVAVIGSRTPSLYGVQSAKTIVSQLSERGALIVSGGALGIDSVAHEQAMEGGGRTVLVMGCGHGSNYLRRNSQLRKRVAQNGALITEYPPYFEVDQVSFQKRNRIISGMSLGVVIIEAADRSGTLNTANHALCQGRDLFVLPGDIASGNYEGSNQLISDGAAAIFSGDDVLKKYMEIPERESSGVGSGIVFEKITEKSPRGKGTKKPSETKKPETVAEKEDKKEEKTEKNIPQGISKNAEIVYNIMSDGINDLDEIKRASCLEVRHVLVALTELELMGYAEAVAPGTYRL